MRSHQPAGIVLTARDLLVLRTLLVARVLDGEQVKIIAGFTSTRRTNRRLLKLVRAGLLRRWFVGTESGGRRALYGLSPQGAIRIGENPSRLIHWKQDALITSSQFLTHQQAVNAALIQARFQPLPMGVACREWLNFKIPISASVPLIPDGYFEILMVPDNSAHPMFVEVDLGTESSTVWMRKVELYLKFAIGGEFERQFHQKRFRVLVVLPSERRLQAVRRAIARRTDKLFWFSTLDDLRREGLFEAIWFRPVGEQRIRLLGEPMDGSSRISGKRESG
jgi:hypothetical protein